MHFSVQSLSLFEESVSILHVRSVRGGEVGRLPGLSVRLGDVLGSGWHDELGWEEVRV